MAPPFAFLDNFLLPLPLTSNLTHPFTPISCHLTWDNFALFLLVHNLQYSMCHPIFTFVFVCHDAVRRPLYSPYNGPYKVLCWQAKYFVLDINGHQKTITLNHLKPAFLESHLPTQSLTPTESSSAPQQYEQSTHSTCSRRRVHFPTCYGTMYIFSRVN